MYKAKPHFNRNIASSMPKPILIIGSGIAGLSLSRTLQRHSIPSLIFDASPSTRRQGFGITLHSWAYDRLQTDNSKFIQAVSTDGTQGALNTSVMDAASGEPLIPIHMSKLREGEPPRAQESFRANRFRLREFLRGDTEVRWEHKLASFESSSGGVIAHFENGKTVEGSLLVGADGVFSTGRFFSLPSSLPPPTQSLIHSLVRSKILPQVTPKIFPVVVYNGILPLPTSEYNSKYAPHMHGSNVVMGVSDNVVLGITINDITPNNVEMSWTYSRPAGGEEGEDPLYKPSRPRREAGKIPEELFEEIAKLGPLAPPFGSIFTPEGVRKTAKYNWLMRSFLIPREIPSNLVGSVPAVLMGDAAHAMPIVAGEGGNHALLDGVELGECIAKHGLDGNVGVEAFYEGAWGRWNMVLKLRRRG